MKSVSTPTAAEIRRALRGPSVSFGFKGLPPVIICDVRRERTPDHATLMVVRITRGKISWAKRITISFIDEALNFFRALHQIKDLTER